MTPIRHNFLASRKIIELTLFAHDDVIYLFGDSDKLVQSLSALKVLVSPSTFPNVVSYLRQKQMSQFSLYFAFVGSVVIIGTPFGRKDLLSNLFLNHRKTSVSAIQSWQLWFHEDF
jgi:hypothetical protein